MLPANTYVVRQAAPSDEAALERIAALDGQRPLSGPVLLGELDGSRRGRVDRRGRVVADPFQLTSQLVLVITMRRRALLAYEKTPSLPARLQAQFRFAH